jgi:SAM-dependent methyltransferase
MGKTFTEPSMGRKSDSAKPEYNLPKTPDDWQALVQTVAARYNREYQQKSVELPPEVESMPIFQDWAAGRLQARIASPFWDLQTPKKNQRWLDIGCGLSFLIYPWREWDAYFYGLEASIVAKDVLNSRGPQLNSKLFKGVELGAAHDLPYEASMFDGVIATGWSCYYPLDYLKLVLAEVKRVLKPEGTFLLDIIDPNSELAEDWAILETYLGSEVFLYNFEDFKGLLQEAGGTIAKTLEGNLFQLLRVRF